MVLWTTICLLVSSFVFAQGEDTPLFLFAGQSNMVGHTTGGQSSDPTQFRAIVRILKRNDREVQKMNALVAKMNEAKEANKTTWDYEARYLLELHNRGLIENITNPMPNAYCSFVGSQTTRLPATRISPTAGCGSTFGHEVMFAHSLASMANWSDRNFTVVKVAKGGTELYKDWNAPRAPLWDQLNSTIHNTTGTWQAIVWHQGENDCFIQQDGEDTSVTYAANLTQFISKIRTEIQRASGSRRNIPVVIVQIHWPYGNPLYTNLVRAQRDFVEKDGNAVLVSTDNLKGFFHLNAASLLIVGDQIAKNLAPLLPNDPPTSAPTLLPTRSTPPTAVPTVTSTLPTQSPILPSVSPTQAPSPLSTVPLTASPTVSSSRLPTTPSSILPTAPPSSSPTATPTATPTQATQLPTRAPTLEPTALPTSSPIVPPTLSSTGSPTLAPSVVTTVPSTSPPTLSPTKLPSSSQTKSPSTLPTTSPRTVPSALPPTLSPTIPFNIFSQPTGKVPTKLPTISLSPSLLPSRALSVVPTTPQNNQTAPTISTTPTIDDLSTDSPTSSESPTTSAFPSDLPTESESPTSWPTTTSLSPTSLPSESPTVSPSSSPTESLVESPASSACSLATRFWWILALTLITIASVSN